MVHPAVVISLLSGLLLAAVLSSGTAVAEASDLSGSRDPLGIQRMPHSWIVGYQRDDSLRPREYALGRVDKTRRDVRVEHEVRASATREWATYEMPAGTQQQDVIDHYLRQINTEALFSCRGRDCGRSNLWANEIFKIASLLGPDRNQFYFAGERGAALIALYIIERGNKRIYAHLEVLEPQAPVALSQNDVVLEQLAGRGQVILDGVTPDRDGKLAADAVSRLSALQAGLLVFEGQTIYVVCHLYGSQPVARLIEQSTSCSSQAAVLLAGDGGPELIPFGAGPLLPRTGSGSRIELVLPHRLSH